MTEAFKNFKLFFENWTIKQEDSAEENFFSIGTRGFFENPFTEVLSYILKSENEYNQRALFLKLLLKNHINDEAIESFISNSNVRTQYKTVTGKYIDLILYNSKYVLVFENKIYHYLANPFEEYENDINMRYLNHERHFIILSYKPEKPPPNWKYINIKTTFKLIANTIVHKFENKWDFFVYDFLNHFSKTETLNMTEEEMKFYEKNFSKIIVANNRLTEYIISIGEDIKSKTAVNRFAFVPTWGDLSKSLRFYPFDTSDNVTLVFNENSNFSIAIYYYKNYNDENIKALFNIVGPDYTSWPESNSSICCFKNMEGKEFIELADAINECNLQIERMITIYTATSNSNNNV